MQDQRLAPRVQSRHDAGRGPQIGLIAQQLQQGVAHTREQQRGHPSDVGQPQGVELMGQGEMTW